MKHKLATSGALLLAALLAAGCIIDEQRCDAHQVEVPGDFALCVCEPNAVFNESGAGCTPCGVNETVVNGVCACSQGFSRPSEGAACMPSAIGAPCGASAPCDGSFPYCVMTGGPEGYCSIQGCSANADCPASFTCEAAGDTRYCRRPPTGLNAPCTSSVDCASFDAQYCETLLLKACLLGGCAQGTPRCPNEWLCCDYSGLLGSPLSFCAAPAMLRDGNCPMGGTRVTQ